MSLSTNKVSFLRVLVSGAKARTPGHREAGKSLFSSITLKLASARLLFQPFLFALLALFRHPALPAIVGVERAYDHAQHYESQQGLQ
jgi:hypothetical protein